MPFLSIMSNLIHIDYIQKINLYNHIHNSEKIYSFCTFEHSKIEKAYIDYLGWLIDLGHFKVRCTLYYYFAQTYTLKN